MQRNSYTRFRDLTMEIKKLKLQWLQIKLDSLDKKAELMQSLLKVKTISNFKQRLNYDNTERECNK